MLAVTATLVGGDLVIAYNAADDVLADIASDGTKYTVTGTGLVGKQFDIADVLGAISVVDNAAGGQEFKVLAGTALANPLQINANVETATLTGGITATKAGDVLIGSAAITLANDVATAVTNAKVEFTGAVTLAQNTTINAGAGAITFKGTVDGAFSLAANSTGATTFGGVVGGNKALVSLTTNAGGTASLLSVKTSGAQAYNDDTVTLNGTYTTTDSKFTVDKNTTLAGKTTVSTGSGTIGFAGTVNGGFDLTANSTATTTFGAAVGGATKLASLTTDALGSVSLKSVATTGGQTYGDDTVTLSGTYATTNAPFAVAKSTTLAGNTKVATGSGTIGFAGTVDGAGGISLNSVAATTFGAVVGGTTPLAWLASDAGGSISLRSVSTVGAQLYGDAATLPVNSTFTSANRAITFSSTLDGEKLATFAAGTGPVAFKGAVGSSQALAGIVLTSAGSTTADSSIKLAKSADSGADGLTVAAGVNNVKMTAVGSSISGFTGNGVSFLGGSTNSQLGGFTVSGNGGNGMNFAAGSYLGTTIAGNTISNNGGNGIVFNKGDYTGTTVRANDIFANRGDGIYLAAAGDKITNLTIGGDKTTAPTSQGNQIYSNTFDGIQADAGDYTGTVIQGNQVYQNTENGIFLNANSGTIGGLLVGAGKAGAVALGNEIYQNTNNGILVGTGTYTGTVIGDHNEITLNTQNGIELAAGGATGLLITGNKIGTLANGTTDRGNVLDGIHVNAGGYAGTSITANSIAFNDIDGIQLAAAGFAITGLSITGNSIYSNDSDGIQADNGDYTGTSIGGNNVYRNVLNGIYLNATGDKITDLLIGGNKAATRNKIYRNGMTTEQHGIATSAGNLIGTTIVGNTIRDNGNKVTHRGNGIFVRGSNLMIGWDAKPGTTNNVANVITTNALHGIEIEGTGAVRNSILSNSIYLNGKMFTEIKNGDTRLVGEGIALTAGGNDAQVAPTIHDVVRDSTHGSVYVQLTVPAAGSYLVQLFANGAEDEQGIFPADANGFQGRTFVGASPSATPTPVGTGKPIISGIPVAGNTLTGIEIDSKLASLVAAGDWITATATLLDGTTPTNTSGFSAGVQALAGQTLAAGGDAQAPNWLSVPTIPGQLTNRYVNELAYKATKTDTVEILAAGQLTLAQLATYTNQNAAGRVIRAGAPSLASGPGTEITLAPNGAANAFGTVTKVTRTGNTAMQLKLSGVSLTAGATGFLVLGTPALPAASLVSVGPALPSSSQYDMLTSLTDPTVVGIGGKGPASLPQAMSFVSRFQGGMRVASADVNGDGYVDLVTAPGDAGADFAGDVFGDAPRIITIFNGNPAGTWQSSSINVSGETGLAAYTGGFQVSLANLRSENTGSRNAVAELVVASANNVFVYEIEAASRGAKPVINPVVAQPVITTAGTVTGLTAGTFTSPTLADIIVATTTASTAQVTQWLASADVSQSVNRPASVTVYAAAANFAPTSTFTLAANLYNGNPVSSNPAAVAPGRLQNMFIGGASLAVGDVDNAPDQKPELILGAGFMGMGNFRVLANDVVVTGNQAAVDYALSAAGQFGRAARGTVNINGKNVWQPTGGPDFFTTNPSAADENLFQPIDGITVAPTGAGFNAPLSVAALQTGADFKARVFAALGATNGTKGTVRAFTWLGADQWIGAKVADVEEGAGPQRGRLTRGNGLRLG